VKNRIAAIRRKTKEVQVRGRLNLDGKGKASISTGIRFLDHMLELFAKHGLFDLELKATGDLDIDLHHTNEDVGLALGEAFKKALGDKKGIRRMGHVFVPMDETLAQVRAVVDVSGRPHLAWGWNASSRQESFRRSQRSGNSLRPIAYDLNDTRHFLESFVVKSEVTLHVDVLKAGGDFHHLMESIFKAAGRSLRDAVEMDRRVRGVPSTKGTL